MNLLFRRFVITAPTLCFLIVPPAAWAWGELGHRVATLVAERRLSAAAQNAIRSLLEPGETLADASLWADRQRDIPNTAYWHYVNVPISETRYSSRYCPPQGCVVGQIRDFEAVLRDAGASREARQVALRFLIHAIEDLHQPLHVGGRGDRGGNDLQVRFFGLGTNLHQVWDFRIIERQSTSVRRMLAEVEQVAAGLPQAEPAGEHESDWATESLTLAREAYLIAGTGRAIRPGTTLNEAYCEKALPVIRTRLAQAGVRLAARLNSVME